MKKAGLFLVLIAVFYSGKGQIFIPQQYVGQSINQVIYNGSFTSTAACTGGTDYDFDLIYSQISPFATGVDLNMQITSITGAATLNGNAVSQGNLFGLAEPVTPFLFRFSSPGTINFSVRATGTPTTAGQIYPCYVVEKVSEFACNNTYTLMEGEVFVPCAIGTATGVSENELKEKLFFSYENNVLIAETETEQELFVTDMLGRTLLNQTLKKGSNTISLPGLARGVYIARMGGKKEILKFVIH